MKKNQTLSIPALFLRVNLFLMLMHHGFLLYAQQSAPTTTKPDSLSSPRKAYLFIRGIEQDEAKRFNPMSALLNITSYLPKKIIHGIHFASGYGTELVNNQKFIDTLEDFFFTDDRTFGWYPIVYITSRFRPRLGINFLYKHKSLETLARGKYSDNKKYRTEASISYRFKKRQNIWRLTFSGLVDYDDDREFYGIGANPKADERSHFRSGTQNEKGIYCQRRWKAQLIVGIRLSSKWEGFLTSYYQKRKLEDTYTENAKIGASFDLNNLPGFQHPVKQWYNEMSLRFDSRNKNAYISGGLRCEGYVGISFGIGEDRSHFYRAGIDLMGSIPVIQKNRILIPRIVFDMMGNLRSAVPVPFTEYPRQPSFRGVPQRKMLRTDNYSLVPSIEYQWPLSFNLGGHLFLDYLVVTNTLERLPSQTPPWAAGLGIDFHGINEELARIQFAFGSEGFRFLLSIGLDPLLSDRSNWK